MREKIFNLISQAKISTKVLAALLVLLIGWFIAKWLGKRVARFLDKTRLNQALKRIGAEETLAKIDTRLNAPKFFGEVVRWFFVVLTLMISTEILSLPQFTQFLAEKMIPIFFNVFIAILIFIVAVFLSDLSQKIVIASLEKERIIYSRFLGKGLSLAIWTLAILAILYQLQIAPTLILIIFAGVVAIIVLVLGIALGLGGKDLAAKFLKELEEKFKK
jgi:hypothetical protein